MQTVSDLMTETPESVGPETTLEEAWHLMRQFSVRHLPVCKQDGSLVGLVTQKDLLMNAHNSAYLKLPVAEVMVLNLLQAAPGDSLLAAAQRMFEKRISCLPVVDGGRLVGILTDTDYMVKVIHLLQQEADQEG